MEYGKSISLSHFFSMLVDKWKALNDKVAIAHSGVFDLDCELISRENHSNKINSVAMDTNEFMTDYQKHNSLKHSVWPR